MKAEYINPFIESVSMVFENMLDCGVELGSVSIAETPNEAPDIIGVIGLSGEARGSVVLRFPVRTALNVISKMVDDDFKSVDSSVIDGVGELVNIIAGNAKTKLDCNLSLSLPSVMRGDLCRLNNLKNVVWLELPFSSVLGDFSLAVNLQPSPILIKETKNESAVGG